MLYILAKYRKMAPWGVISFGVLFFYSVLRPIWSKDFSALCILTLLESTVHSVNSKSSSDWDRPQDPWQDDVCSLFLGQSALRAASPKVPSLSVEIHRETSLIPHIHCLFGQPGKRKLKTWSVFLVFFSFFFFLKKNGCKIITLQFNVLILGN